GALDGWRAADRAGLADALDAERVARRAGLGAGKLEVGQDVGGRHGVVAEGAGDELALVVVDDLFAEGLGGALGDAAVALAVEQHRVDDGAAVVDGDEAPQGGPTGVRIDVDDGDVDA